MSAGQFAIVIVSEIKGANVFTVRDDRREALEIVARLATYGLAARIEPVLVNEVAPGQAWPPRTPVEST